MFRHDQTCSCPACQSLSRVSGLINAGCNLPGFLQVATGKLRVLEGELRDEVAKFGLGPGLGPLGVPLDLPPPNFLQGKGGFLSGPPIRPPPGYFEGGTGVNNSQGASQPGESVKGVSSKSAAAEPPQRLHPGQEASPAKVIVKEEPRESPKTGRTGLAEASFVEEELGEKRRKKSRSRRRKRSKSHHKRTKEDKKSEDSTRKNRREKSEEPSRGEKRSPSRKELQRRPERSSGSKGEGGEYHGEEIEEENREEEDRKRRDRDRPVERTAGQRRGPGWKGRIPYSDHQRWWQGKNKGVVKRAKQERFNARRR